MSGYQEKRSARPVWLGKDRRTWDHVRVHHQVVLDPCLDSDAIAVYVGLTVHAELQSGRCFPSWATLAAYGRVSERTVGYRLKVLEELGYITRTPQLGKATVFELKDPKVAKPIGPVDALGRLQVVQGLKGEDLCSRCKAPPHQVQTAFAAPADEQEPVTRTKNHASGRRTSSSRPELGGAHRTPEGDLVISGSGKVAPIAPCTTHKLDDATKAVAVEELAKTRAQLFPTLADVG